MPFPPGVQTVTLTAGAAGYRALDGDPYQGTIRLTPSVSRVVSAEHGVIALGSENITLGASGEFTKTLLAIDAEGFSPSGWTYRVDEEFTNAPSRSYNISLPASAGTVALSSLAPVESAAGVEIGAEAAGTAAAAVAAHNADTTDVHGIVDTAALETQAGAASKVAVHSGATDPHGDRAWADGKFATALDLTALGGTVNSLAVSVTNLDTFVGNCLTRVQNIEQGEAWLAALNVAGDALISGGQLQVNGTPGALESLPAGYGSSATATGLTLGSTYPSDDVVGGTDGTGRLNLYSYQRANTYSFGEVTRIFGMRKDSKQMLAWYHPANGYAADRTPNAGNWKPVTWVGTHWESNGHTGNHKHWEVEIPDSQGALHGRLEILFGRQSDETIGLDKTNIITNLADLTVRCHGTDTSGGDIQQALRLSAAAGYEKPIEWANDTDGVVKRWKLRATSEAESGSNAGANMQLVRYDDAGTPIDVPLQVTRSTGQITIGGTGGTSAGLVVNRNGGVALTVSPLAIGGQAILVNGTDATTAAYQATVTGDTTNRYRVLADGKTEWGPGNAARDVNLYRSSAGVLRTDQSLHVTQNLRMNTTSVGGGVGVIGVANATTVPGSNPTGGGVLYASGGALFWRGSSGTVTQIAPA